MVFSSVTFIGVFLPLTLVVYYLFKNRACRNTVLLIASLIFYAWGEPVYILAMLTVTVIDYVFGLILNKTRSKAAGSWLLALCIVLNLIPLVTFKYYNFFASQIGLLLHFTPRMITATMPIGISFFTFQSMSYAIDVYRKNAKTQRNYAYVLLYVSMFPQLVAGPIVRYSDVENEITDRNETMENFLQGSMRFAVGFAKKVIFANYAGIVAEYLMGERFGMLTVSGAWVGMLTGAFQLYFDFSGYSDMAIGLGLMFGFHFKENFRYPFIARSLTDFWTRWHISMSNWFRDYVMYPMVLSRPFTRLSRYVRKKFGPTMGNLIPSSISTLVTFTLVGLWHGADWNFILWGVYCGVFLVIEKTIKLLFKVDMGKKIPVVAFIITFLLARFGHVIFYYTNLSDIVEYFKVLFGAGAQGVGLNLHEASKIYQILWLYPLLIVGVTPLPAKLCHRLLGDGRLYVVMRTVWTVVLIAVSYILLLGQSFNAFMYFRF